MATSRAFARTVYSAIAVLLLLASPDVSFAAGQASCDAPPPHIVVVGSVNIDLTVRVNRPPSVEETVTAIDPRVSVAVGGKGANQAVAAARLVAGSRPVKFVCQFGGDAHASMLEQELVANGVDLSLGGRHPDLPSGTGFVMLSPGGEASSVVVGGANSAWPENDDELVSTMVRAARGAAVMLLQREVPDRVNLAAAAAAKIAGVPIVLDTGGVDAPVPTALLEAADYLCPNESELARLTDLPTRTEDEVAAAGRALVARGARRVIVTLGERGAVAIGEEGVLARYPPVVVPGGRVVDGTAAGDAFRAALGVAIAEGIEGTERGMALASAAGAYAVSVAGAVPSLPTRDAAEAHLPEDRRPPAPGDPKSTPCASVEDARDVNEECPLRFGSRLNSMKERPDLWKGGKLDVLGMVRRLGTAEGIDLVDFNYPQHLGGLKPKAVTGALKAAGLAAGAVAVRFPASTFRAGAFTNPDPSVRAAAVDIVAAACGWAQSLEASAGVIVWPQFDGYDYHMQINYTTTWRRGVDAIRAALDRDECEGVKLSYEFKPTDPSSRFALVPSTAAALTLVSDVDRPGRFGLTLDAGHLVAAGENPAQSAAMVADAGVLFGFHLGDVHSKLAAEDGLAFGSVHAAGALELVYWLRASYGSAGGYAGYAYFDTFPEAEDPTREAAYNVRAFKRMWRWAARLENDGIRDVLLNHDAMTSLEMQEGLIA